jgi:hypothetical protein
MQVNHEHKLTRVKEEAAEPEVEKGVEDIVEKKFDFDYEDIIAKEIPTRFQVFFTY